MTEFFQNLLKLIQENQIILTSLGLGGAGTIILWLKGIPQAIYNLFKRELTTEIVITNQHIAFYNIMKLMEKLYANKNFRKLKVLNGRWGDEKSVIGIGYGFHVLKYKKRWLFTNLTKESANQTNYDKDTLSFLKLGRSHKVFDELIEEAENLSNDINVSKIYKMEDVWHYTKDQRRRSIESIFLESHKKKYLLDGIQKFLSSEEWYLSHGIPYQLGILLYGPPGTGKTSLIKAIASYLNYSIYYLPSSRLYKIEKAVSTLPDNSILVIEDIDTDSATNKRGQDWGDMEEKNKSEGVPLTTPPTQENSINKNMIEAFEKMGLSGILNSLDGIFATHGRILVATTNHIEALDPALIRPGRIDMRIELGYVNNDLLKIFCNSFFPDDQVDFNKVKIKKQKLTIAFLQNMVLEGKSLQEIIEYVETKVYYRIPNKK